MWRDTAHAIKDFEHGRAASDETVEAEGREQLGIEFQGLQIPFRRLDHLSHARSELGRGERLRQVIRSALEDGVNRCGGRVVLADENDFGAGILPHNAAQKVGLAGAGNVWVQQDESRLLTAYELEGLFAFVRRGNADWHIAQRISDAIVNLFVGIDDQHRQL